MYYTAEFRMRLSPRVPVRGRSSSRCPRTPMWWGGGRPPSLVDVRWQELVQSSTLCLWSRCFMTLCRRWWNSWWTFSHLSISLLPSRLTRCPRSCVHPAVLARFSGSRRRQNSWWMFRRCCLILRSSSLLSSRPLTFQLPVVQEGEGAWRSSRSPWTGFNSVFGADRVDIPGGGSQGSRSGQGSAASSSLVCAPDDAGQGFFFRTSPRREKVRG